MVVDLTPGAPRIVFLSQQIEALCPGNDNLPVSSGSERPDNSVMSDFGSCRRADNSFYLTLALVREDSGVERAVWQSEGLGYFFPEADA